MKKVRSGRVLIIFGLLAAVAAYAQARQKSKGHMTPSSEQRMEQRIAREVGHELRMLPNYGMFDNLTYKVSGGTVTLAGQVNQATLKDDAEHRVKKIEGVEKVVNEIEILPVSPNDDRLRRQVARVIFQDQRLSHYSIQAVPPIHIIVRGGNVFLEGVVRDESDKNVAGIRANSVPGVFSVTNNLRVEKPADRKRGDAAEPQPKPVGRE